MNKREKSLTWISITDEGAFETAVFEMQGTREPGNYCCFISLCYLGHALEALLSLLISLILCLLIM